MLGPLLALLAQTAATPTLPPKASTDIIVIGRRAEQDLAACLASHCPPAKDIEASLQASIEQFAAGRYDDARHTLQKSIGRNREHAAALPGPVSSLYATLATVAEHSGDTTLWLLSARSDVVVLRRHLGEANPATLREELAFADSLIGLGQPSSAASRYRKVQRMATARGRTDLASGAAFRGAWLAALTGDEAGARRGADEAVALAGDGPAARQMRDIIQARIAIRRGDDGAIDRLAARLRQSPTDIPQLLFAPAVSDINPVRTGFQQNPWNDASIRFADIGYWIRPDGRTAGVELLRNNGLGAWTPGILKQVGQRRYVPLEVEPGEPGLYRIDRFTVRGTMGVPTGSHIVQRMGDLSVHVVDLTATDAMSDAQRARTQAATRPSSD